MSEETIDCAGDGDTLTFNCTVLSSAGGATVWMGTALDCPYYNEITLLHSLYKSGRGAFGSCNDRAIVAQSLGVEDSYYTSQLNVTVTSNTIGKTIICENALNLTNSVVQFSTTIKNITGIIFIAFCNRCLSHIYKLCVM